MTITVNDYDWKIEYVDGNIEKMHPDDDSFNLGLTEYTEQIVSIRTGMSATMERQTVIHELVHVFLFSYGYSVTDEESMCNFIGSQIDRIMKLTDEILKRKAVKTDVD